MTPAEATIPRKLTAPWSFSMVPIGTGGVSGPTLTPSDWYKLAASIGVDASAFDSNARARIDEAIFWARNGYQTRTVEGGDVIKALRTIGCGGKPDDDHVARIAGYALRSANTEASRLRATL